MIAVNTIIFDFDGTLLDSKQLVLKVFETCVQKTAVDISKELFMQLFGKSVKDVRIILSDNLEEREISDFLDCYFNELLERVEAGEVTLFPGVIPVLKFLRDAGWKLALCTNLHTPFLNAYRRIFNLDQYFRTMYWAGKTDGEIVSKKVMIKNILKDLDSDYGIMIGDRAVDIKAALENNILSIGCLYGFGSKEELKIADYLITDIREIPDLVSKITKY